MRFHTYTKFSPEAADAVDLQSLLDNLADFLLQSGFAGGTQFHPYWGETGDEADRSLDALKQAILDALIKSGQFTPEMLEALRGDGDELSEQKLAELLDTIVQRLIEEGYLNLDKPPEMPAGHQNVTGPGRARPGRGARRAVQPHRQGHRLPRLQGAPRHPLVARKVELRLARHGLPRHRHRVRRLEQAVRVRRHAEPRRQRDAEERARAQRQPRRPDRPRLRRPHGAPGRVPLELRDGADARLLALHDPLRRGPLHARQEGRARPHAPDPHAVPRRHAQGRALPRLRRGDPARRARRARRWVRTTPTPPRGSSSRDACCSRRRRTCARS